MQKLFKKSGLLIIVLIMLFSSVGLVSSALIDSLQIKNQCSELYSFKILGAFGNTPEIGSGDMVEFLNMYTEKMEHTSYCAPGDIYLRSDIGHDRSVLFGGFLYSSISIDEQQFYLWAKSDERDENAWVSKSYVYYDLNNEEFSTLNSLSETANLDEFLSTHKNDLSLSKTFVFSNVHAKKKSGAKDTESTITPNFEPGIYYAIGGLNLNYGNTDKDDGYAKLRPIRINLEDEWSLEYDLKNIDSSGKGYLFSYRPLTAQELNTNFKGYVENTSTLCSAAGGEVLEVEIEDMPSERVCCGDDTADQGFTITHEDTTHYCSGGKWYDLENLCRDRVVDERVGDSVWAGDYFDSIEDLIDYKGGADGCCGDDAGATTQDSCVAAVDYSYTGTLECSNFLATQGDQGCQAGAPDFCKGTAEVIGCRGSYTVENTGSAGPDSYPVSCEEEFSANEPDCIPGEGCTYSGACAPQERGTIGGGTQTTPVPDECYTEYDRTCDGTKSCSEYDKAWAYYTFGPCDRHCEEQEVISEDGDLGYISSDGSFACFDNSREGTGRNDPIYTYEIPNSPNNNFTWRYAEQFPGYIMQAEDTFFISNYAEWHYCDATNKELYGTNKLNEYETLPIAEAAENPACYQELTKFLGEDVVNCEVYDESGEYQGLNFCKGTASQENWKAYCPNTPIGPLTFNALDAELDTCLDGCYIETGEGYDSLSNWADNDPNDYQDFELAYCEVYSHDENCQNEKDINPSDSFLESSYCKSNPESCLSAKAFSTQDTCEDIHSTLEFYYPENNPSEKLCEDDDYCQGGVLIDSADNAGTCCVGAQAQCAPIRDLTCSTIGGQRYDTNKEICAGKSVIADSNDCCLGTVRPHPSVLLPSFLNSNAFMCYAHNDKDFISECCGGNDCQNIGNRLDGAGDLLSTTYSLTGASYHMVSSFDSLDYGERILQIKASEDYPQGNLSLRYDITHKSIVSFKNTVNAEGFEFLEFDFATNDNQYMKQIILKTKNVMESDEQFAFDLNDSAINSGDIENGRWRRIKINISELRQSEYYPIKTIEDIIITFNNAESVSGLIFLMDRLYLTSNDETDYIQNSENRFCSGSWGKWIENHDGDDDTGFFSGANPRGYNEYSISKYGPYKDACEGTMSYGWTGSACCGDDTHNVFGEDKEYWIDSQGICWAGVAALHDNSVANAISQDYSQRPEAERRLMFYGGQPWVCDTDNLDSYNQPFTFSNSTKLNTKLQDKIAQDNIASPFTIRGKWICDASKGWVKLDDMNRLTLMSAFLSQEANRQGDEFTLHCGEMGDVVNIDNDVDDALLGGFCALRVGKNYDFIKSTNNNRHPQGDIFLTFESENLNSDILSNLNTSILGVFETLYGAEDDMNVNLDCSNANLNPTGDEFFNICDFESEYFKGSVYYNKPLKIVLIASEKLESPSFLQNFWDSLMGLFKNMIGGDDGDENSYLKLANFSEFDESKRIYIAKQGDKLIVGKEELLGSHQKIRVDYTNLSTNLSFFADMINNGEDEIKALWSPNNYVQTIVTLTKINDGLVNFNEITSRLRITAETEREDFGQSPSCQFEDKQGISITLESGNQDKLYLNGTSTNCERNSEIIMCHLGDILYQNKTRVITENYYETCDAQTQSLTIRHELSDNLISDIEVPFHVTNYAQGTHLNIEQGSTITITTNNENYPIINWVNENTNYESQGDTITITLDEDTTLTATFGCTSNDDCEDNYVCGLKDNMCVESNNLITDIIEGDCTSPCETLTDGECTSITDEWVVEPVWDPWNPSYENFDSKMSYSVHHIEGIYCNIKGNPVYTGCTTRPDDFPDICANIKCLYEFESDFTPGSGCAAESTGTSICDGYRMIDGQCNTRQEICVKSSLAEDQYYVPECQPTNTDTNTNTDDAEKDTFEDKELVEDEAYI